MLLHVKDRTTNDTKRKRSKVSHPGAAVQQNVRNLEPSRPPNQQVDDSSPCQHHPCEDDDDDGAAAATNTADDDDGGHRFGNFREYYKFHPVDHRMPLLEPLLRHIVWHHNSSVAARSLLNKKDTKKQQKDVSNVPIRIFRYLDIGCNEGDLTLAVAEQLQTMNYDYYPAAPAHAANQMTANVLHVRGMDLDPLLIDRARIKVAAALLVSKQPPRNNGLEHSVVNGRSNISFETVNVLQDGIPPCEDTDDDDDGYVADLTSLFSTTMWLHIHGGDDGLRRVLQQICQCTRHWILLEVQPSKCYGKAALRWRKKMGDHPPPLDVSPQRLQLRARIDEAVEEMLQQNGFERVRIVLDEQSEESNGKTPGEGRERGRVTADQGKEIEPKTPWNRSCRLYRRVLSH